MPFAACRAEEPGAGFHVMSYTLDLTPHIAAASVDGVETISLRSLQDGLRSIVFSGNALTIDSATSEGHALQVSSTGKAVSFELPKVLRQGQQAMLRIVYHGVPKHGLVFTPVSVYSSYAACEWMICSEDAPGDKAMFSLDLHVPAGMTSLAVGTLTSTSKQKDGSKVDHWRTQIPYSAYLFNFAVGKFAEASERQGGKELAYVSEIATAAELPRLFDETAAMVTFLSDKAGVPLPPQRYAELLVPGKEAQEAATYSIIGKDYLDSKNDWVTIHELSHQWWGNLLTCATWKDFWLNEGITSFMVAAWKEQRYGRDAYADELGNAQKAVDALRAQGGDRPLAYGGEYPNIRQRRTIQYSKGAVFMGTLRTLLGEDAFWAGLRSYTRAHAGGIVTSIDFERSMEKASGRDLSAVFAEWVFEQPHAGKGEPLLKGAVTAQPPSTQP